MIVDSRYPFVSQDIFLHKLDEDISQQRTLQIFIPKTSHSNMVIDKSSSAMLIDPQIVLICQILTSDTCKPKHSQLILRRSVK